MILRYLFRNLCSISMFELETPQLDAISSDGFQDCLVQQQVIFDRQLGFAAEQSVHFARLNCKLS